jgi:DNA-binding NtrC family response regulator
MDPQTTKAVAPGGSRLISHKIRLEVVEGPCRGLVAELAGPEVRIGSERSADLVIKDPTVSRRHLLLHIEDKSLRVVDAGSRNGTFLDGIRIRDAYARPDSIITIGDTKLRLRMLDDLVELPLYESTSLGGLLGQSPAMRLVFALIKRVAKTNETVLVEGETGTGKELVAEALHAESTRSQGPFQIFDCSAISASLMEDALFGHVRGAFTGATSDQTGAFQSANGGTLFLDEIGELPLELQPKLLRALQNRKIRQVGSTTDRRVDVRIVAATNRNLAREVELGRFREDLYFRLNVIRIQLPPLRERVEDIPLLVRHFEASIEPGTSNRAPLEDDEVAALMERSFDGNVRELGNVVRRMHALGISGNARERNSPASVAPEHAEPGVRLNLPLDLSLGFHEAKERVIEAFKRQFYAEALRRSNGNVSKAAQDIGVSRRVLHRAINDYELRGDDNEK